MKRDIEIETERQLKKETNNHLILCMCVCGGVMTAEDTLWFCVTGAWRPKNMGALSSSCSSLLNSQKARVRKAVLGVAGVAVGPAKRFLAAGRILVVRIITDSFILEVLVRVRALKAGLNRPTVRG